MHGTRLYTASAYIIKRKNSGEADRLITVFTKKFGKLRLLARGVRKISSKRAPHIEIFNQVVITAHKSTHNDTLTDVSPVASHEAIRKDLRRIYAAYYLCELVDGLLPIEQTHDDVFALLGEALTALGAVKPERIDLLRARFAAALLTRLGYMEEGKRYKENEIDIYVEQILEHKLKTVRLASRINI